MNDIGSVVLTNTIAACGLAALALIVCCLVRLPEFAHKAWLVVLLKLVVPAMFVLPVLPSLVRSSQGESKANQKPTSEIMDRMADPQPGLIGPRWVAVPHWVAGAEALRCPSEVPEALQGRWGVEDSASATRPPAAPEKITFTPGGTDDDSANGVIGSPADSCDDTSWTARQWVAIVWAVGALGYWSMVVAGACRFNSRLRQARPAKGETLSLADDVARRVGLRRRPNIAVMDSRLSPLVWAPFLGIRLILPSALWNRLSGEQQEAILAHEMAHLARQDHWVRRLEVLILGLYWWLPLAWFARTRLRRAEESCCDERVLRAYPELAPAYAEALIEVTAFVNRPARMAFASGGFATTSELKRRVQMILSNRKNSPPSRWIGAALFAGVVALMVLRPGAAQEAPPAAPTNPVIDPPPVTSPPEVPAPPATPGVTFTAPAAAKRAAPVGYYGVVGNSDSNVQQLKDEVELLEVQLGTKEAHLAAATSEANMAAKNFEELKSASRLGAVSRTDLVKAESDVAAAQGRVAVMKAELNEHKVKLKQAKRRLAEATSGQKTRSGSSMRSSNTTTISKPKEAIEPVTTPAPKAKNPPRTSAADATRSQNISKQLSDLEAHRAQLHAESAKLKADMAKLEAQQRQIIQSLEQLRRQIARDKEKKSDPAGKGPDQR